MEEVKAQIDREFAAYRADKDRTHLETVFHLIDRNHSNTITKQELVDLMQVVIGDRAEAQAAITLSFADKNADSVLTIEEYVEFMLKNLSG